MLKFVKNALNRRAVTRGALILSITCSIIFSGFGSPSAATAATIPGPLVKASFPAVYYVDQSGKRHAFPTESIYYSWYADFDSVVTIGDAELASIPLGNNVTYRPGTKLVKITTDPKVYAVAKGGILRWIKTEAVATALYGQDWNNRIDDIPDAFFTNYAVGTDIQTTADFSVASEMTAASSIDEDRTAALPPVGSIHSDIPKKFLTLLSVNSGTQAGFSDNTWERTLRFKESDALQIFELAIWANGVSGNPNRISLYKFDRNFDPNQPQFADGGSAWLQYRESYNILNTDLPAYCVNPTGQTYYECSGYKLEAFKMMFRKMVETQPASHYSMMYLGHGSAVGLFADSLSAQDSTRFLSYTNELIGKKLDYVDWGTNCDMGTVAVVENEYPYTDFILTSDLLRGGFMVGDSTGDYESLRPWHNLSLYFSPERSIRESLVSIADAERRFWENPASKQDMSARAIMQSLSIYDTNSYQALKESMDLNQIPVGDVLTGIRSEFPASEQKFNDFRFYYVNNKDFFPWPQETNGFRKN